MTLPELLALLDDPAVIRRMWVSDCGRRAHINRVYHGPVWTIVAFMPVLQTAPVQVQVHYYDGGFAVLSVGDLFERWRVASETVPAGCVSIVAAANAREIAKIGRRL